MPQARILLLKRFRIALLFLVVSATYGLLMRLQHIVTIPKFVYSSFLQAHSHVTFLGWGFLAITSLAIFVFVPHLFSHKIIKNSFWIMVSVLVGMLISFPLQGYKVFSIAFLSVFLVTSYVFLIVLYKNLKNKFGISAWFVRYGIVYYFISSMAIWAIPVIKLKVGKGDLYHYGVAFYTHFLYNGFFVLVLFGLLSKFFIDNKVITEESRALKLFFRFTNLAVIPTFLLVFLKEDKLPEIILIIAAMGAVLQVISLFYLKTIIVLAHAFVKTKDFVIRILFYTLIIAYIGKIALQFFSAFPVITKRALLFTPYLVIGYIHLFTLGFMSVLLLFLYRVYAKQQLHLFGLLFFIAGIVLSETMLFLQGGLLYFNSDGIPKFDLILFVISFFMPLGLLLLFIRTNSRNL